MLVHQAFRFELDPSARAAEGLRSHTGASRFAFNWALALVKSRLERRDQIRVAAYKELLSDEETDAMVQKVAIPWSLPSLRKEWNRAKADVAPWWGENSKEAYNSGLDAVARAFEGFFKARSGEGAGTVGFPRFKKKWAKKSCRFTTGTIKVPDHYHVQLPRLGVIRTKEKTTTLRTKTAEGSARILSATVSSEAGRWFVSFTTEVERDDKPVRHSDSLVAVDLGVAHLATLSNGTVVKNPRALSRYRRRMKRLAREVLRRQPSSKRRQVSRQKLARGHARVVHIRRDALHQLSTDLASTYRTVVIEDLAVKNMTAAPKPVADSEHPGTFRPNGSLAKAGLNTALLDVSPAEFRRQLTYKLRWHGGTLVVVNRWFPSSKTCSRCQAVKTKLPLRERIYCCEKCHLVIDRDFNAALNLAAYGRQAQSVAVSGTETENGRGRDNGAGSTGSGSRAKRQDGSGQPGKAVTASSTGEAA